ncbi:uncharacterized protein UTRI_02573 [Ustilago trichophora]|uniref:Uncharacterized protein n=1 Tax=Ustilago trichophora TaxID=86804 RepID=A0A5C3E9G6_9BASI|nr:uncharacterized protein UTRI_02573 [Ustilago trichophora]
MVFNLVNLESNLLNIGWNLHNLRNIELNLHKIDCNLGNLWLNLQKVELNVHNLHNLWPNLQKVELNVHNLCNLWPNLQKSRTYGANNKDETSPAYTSPQPARAFINRPGVTYLGFYNQHPDDADSSGVSVVLPSPEPRPAPAQPGPQDLSTLKEKVERLGRALARCDPNSGVLIARDLHREVEEELQKLL